MASNRAVPRTLPDFQRLFPDEDACRVYLEGVRWPSGFACPKCEATESPFRFKDRLRVVRCRKCRTDVRVTAGTVMADTRSPLQHWFWGAFLVTSHTPGLSALQFQRQLGITRYETAFHMLHKLRAAMVRPDREPIGVSHRVEVDETYVGGRTRGLGRGVTLQTLVGGAVEVRPRPKADKRSHHKHVAGRLRLKVLRDRGRNTLEEFVCENVAPGSHVLTDGYDGYNGLCDLGYDHRPTVVGRDPEKLDETLPMIHIAFANLKTWLQGTHHGVSSKHLPAYLNEFVFRFNRRFFPMSAFHSLLGIAVRVAGPTYRGLHEGGWRHPGHAP